MTFYLDTSALVKLYIDEPDSAALRARVGSPGELATSAVAYPEARAAFAAMRRSGRLSGADYRRSLGACETDWPGLMVVGISAVLCRNAGDLAERFALRGFDAVHLACFAEIAAAPGPPLEFLSFDVRLSRAARLWRAGR
jgi:predicted nucleic acid-binding protein